MAAGSISFNGTSQYLNVGGTGSFVAASNFTFETWVYPTTPFATTNVIFPVQPNTHGTKLKGINANE